MLNFLMLFVTHIYYSLAGLLIRFEAGEYSHEARNINFRDSPALLLLVLLLCSLFFNNLKLQKEMFPKLDFNSV